jgi:hypothetical protein
MNGYTGKAGKEDLIDGLVIQDLVRWKDETIGDRSHDLAGMFFVQ